MFKQKENEQPAFISTARGGRKIAMISSTQSPQCMSFLQGSKLNNNNS